MSNAMQTTKIVSPTGETWIEYVIQHHPSESIPTGRIITAYDDYGHECQSGSHAETSIRQEYDTHQFKVISCDGKILWSSICRQPCYSQDGQKILVLAECSDTILVYAVTTGLLLMQLKGRGSSLVDSPVHQKHTIACDNGLQTYIYDVNTLTCLVTLDGINPLYNSDHHLATIHDNQTLLYDTENWSLLSKLTGVRPNFSPNHQTIITYNITEHRFYIFELKTYQLVFQMDQAYSCQYSPNGHYLLMDHGSLSHLYETQSWTKIGCLQGYQPIFSPNGTSIALYELESHRTLVYKTSSCRLLANLCGACPRYSSDGQTLITNGGHSYETQHWSLV